jgi:hypothetical protein
MKRRSLIRRNALQYAEDVLVEAMNFSLRRKSLHQVEIPRPSRTVGAGGVINVRLRDGLIPPSVANCSLTA